MHPLYTFKGNGSGGSVSLKIFSNFVEYEHNNYFAIVPLGRIESVTYSKKDDDVYARVKIGDIEFGCDNKQEVYEAIRQAIAGFDGVRD